MKPFDLEAAKNGAAVCLSDGTPVKILDFEFKNRNSCKLCCKYIRKGENSEYVFWTDQRGIAEGVEENTLFMEPVVAYMNVYKDLDNMTLRGDRIYATKEECEENTLKMEFYAHRGIAKVELL